MRVLCLEDLGAIVVFIVVYLICWASRDAGYMGGSLTLLLSLLTYLQHTVL